MKLLDTRLKRLLVAFFATAVFFVMVIAFAPVQFETNDDYGLMMWIAGYCTGEPSAYELGWTTFCFSFFVSRLYMLLPMIPWYTVSHLFVLWFSFSIICFCLIDSGSEGRAELIVSCVAVICVLSAVALYSIVMLQFTTTPAAAGGSAVTLLVHYKKRSRRYLVFSVLTISLLMAFSFSIRTESFLACAALYLCIAVVCYIRSRRWRMQILMVTLIPFIAVSALYAIDWIAYSTPEYRAFRDYNRERNQFMANHRPSYRIAPEVYKNAGLNEKESALVDTWRFMFEKTGFEMFKKLNDGVAEYYEEYPPATKIPASRFNDYLNPIGSTPYHTYGFLLIVFSAFVVILAPGGIKVNPEFSLKERIMLIVTRHSNRIIAAGILVFFLLGVIYFIEMERIPSRVYRMLLLASSPALMLLVVKTLNNRKRKTNTQLALLCIIIPCTMAFISVNLLELEARKSSYAGTLSSANEYAINHPEKVYFNDVGLYAIIDPFTVYRNEKPTNMISVVGSEIHSPLYLEQLRRNGFDRVSQSVMLDDHAYLMVRNLSDTLVAYYAQEYPEYEFVMTDYVEGAGVGVYKLTMIKLSHSEDEIIFGDY